MKWFLSVCALVAGLGIAAASCGPKQDFCPTTNPDPTDFTCHANNDATSMGGQGGGGLGCDGPEMVCGDTAHTHVCKLSDCP
jgi:hypothetical protein